MEPRTDVDLLEHRDFVRAVARGILADEHAADDVVQETCLRALERPPRALRGWLARVAKNLALTALRREKTRDRRERAGARPEGQPSVAEAASRLEQHRLVVEAVLALEEPFRSAILLRFYEDRKPREIARELGVPVDTVRSRLRRGLERLRARFDERHGGDRAAWSLALLPLLGAPASLRVLVTEGAVMSAKAKLSVAAVFLCIAAVGTVTWQSASARERAARSESARPAPPEVEGARGHGTAPEAPPDSEPEASEPTDTAADATLATEPQQPKPYRLAEATGEAQGALRILVRDDDGNGKEGVGVHVTRARASKSRRSFTTGPDGCVELRSLAATKWVVFAAVRGRYSSAEVEVVKGLFTEVVVVFARGATVEGEVRHLERGPLPDVGVAVEIGNRDDGFQEWFRADTDAQGRYRLEGIPAGTHPVLVWGGILGQDQHPRAMLTVPEHGPLAFDIVVGRVALRGTLRDADTGAPLGGVLVKVLCPPHQPAETTTQTSGSYEILDLPAGDAYVVEVDGYAPRVQKAPPIPPDAVATADIALKKAAVLGITVLDQDGRLVPGRHGVTLKDARGGLTEFTIAVSNAGWHFGVLPGTYELTLRASGYVPKTERVELKADENKLTLRLEPVADTKSISLQGTVRDSTTRKPVGGARVRITWPSLIETATDADGAYLFRELKPGTVTVRASRDGYGIGDVLEIDVGGEARTLDIDLDPAATLRLHVLDRTGAPVSGKVSLVIVGRGENKTDMGAELTADAHGHAVYRQIVPGSYHLLVSQPGAGEAKVESDIAPGENVVRVRLE
ncbi:MAG: sigma-70 family RNA polymerase sigma factor [Planctomycetota bacterium]